MTQVGDFLILKSDNEATKNGEAKPPLWRVDGKTLIQKYECTDKVNKNTLSKIQRYECTDKVN